MAAASSLFNALNGIFCVYKPPGKSISLVVRALQMNLAREMNKLPCRPMRTKLEVQEGLIPTVSAVPDLADHPLVVGLRYMKDDFRISTFDALDYFSSGVSVFGIGNGAKLIWPLKSAKLLKVYHVDGELGKVTWDHKTTGKLAEQTTYHNVKASTIDRIVSGMQANHQRNMFIASGLDLQSDEAYQMACAGPVRPGSEDHQLVIYGMKMIYFKPPHFTIEIHSINETGSYFAKLIHNIGLEARSSAFCTKIRRIRVGRFDLQSAMLLKHASDPKLLAENIALCSPLIETENRIHFPILRVNDSKLLPPSSDNLE